MPAPFVPAGYLIEGPLDEGGSDVVYRACRESDDVAVAIKYLFAVDDADRRRFWRQRLTLTGLDHPNLVRLLEIGSGPPPASVLYCVMELLPGGSLCDRMDEFRDPTMAMNLIRSLAVGLAYLWEKKEVVHRDLKPDNVLFRADGTPCLVDFGIARRAGIGSITMGEILGTDDYSSPEQRRGEEIDGRADIWSLGVLLHELLTGQRPPHTGDARPSRLAPGVSPQLDLVTLGCLHDRADRRYDATALIKALDAAMKSEWPSPPTRVRPNYQGKKIGMLDLGVRVLIGGDGVTRYRHPDGIICTYSRERFVVPEDVHAIIAPWLADRIRINQQKHTPFTDGDQIRLDNWGLAHTEERIERPWPLYLTCSLSNYYAMQQTNNVIDWSLPDRRTVRETHAAGIDDLEESRLANPLAVNLSIVTTDNVIYVARRGKRVGVNIVYDADDSVRVPMVSGTANPEFDLLEDGRYDPFSTAIREAVEEALPQFDLQREDVTLFGLARTHAMLFPFLFGEARPRGLTSVDFESRGTLSPGDIAGKEGRPLTIDAIVPWIKQLHASDKKAGRLMSHTCILSLYMSLIYAYPDRIDEIHRRLSE